MQSSARPRRAPLVLLLFAIAVYSAISVGGLFLTERSAVRGVWPIVVAVGFAAVFLGLPALYWRRYAGRRWAIEVFVVLAGVTAIGGVVEEIVSIAHGSDRQSVGLRWAEDLAITSMLAGVVAVFSAWLWRGSPVTGDGATRARATWPYVLVVIACDVGLLFDVGAGTSVQFVNARLNYVTLLVAGALTLGVVAWGMRRNEHVRVAAAAAVFIGSVAVGVFVHGWEPLFFALFMIFADGLDSRTEHRLQDVRVGSYYVAVYGEHRSFNQDAVVIRQEKTVLPGVRIGRDLLVRAPAEDATVTPMSGGVHIAVDGNSSDTATVPLRPFLP